jgi:hypothetical protein
LVEVKGQLSTLVVLYPNEKTLWHPLNRREKKGSVHLLDVVEARKIAPAGMELRIYQLLA